MERASGSGGKRGGIWGSHPSEEVAFPGQNACDQAAFVGPCSLGTSLVHRAATGARGDGVRRGWRVNLQLPGVRQRGGEQRNKGVPLSRRGVLTYVL